MNDIYAASSTLKWVQRDDAVMVELDGLDDRREQYQDAGLDEEQSFETWAETILESELADYIDLKRQE